MASDYATIRRDNERRYGTDIGRIGPLLLSDRYDDRTHFIFELLQNAEDALARRQDWSGSRAVSFHLTKTALRVTHHGTPFNEADVRGICGIAENPKGLTAIGRFGIGFKSVCTFTDRPEVHSGLEAFAIENFVWPVAVSSIDHVPDETIILIPLRSADDAGRDEIAAGLDRLGVSTLLFLRQIKEISWSIEGGKSGHHLREVKPVAKGVRRVTVIGQAQGEAGVCKEWLVFARPVSANDGRRAGHVELAFSLGEDEKGQRARVQATERSPLVVFFPTVIETHLGFLVQGPYRTTPSRDNVPPSDDWNQHLVGETATLLVDALRRMRDQRVLDTNVLRCLPIEPAKFEEDSMFAPLYQATKTALLSEPLLPRADTGYVSARNARLGRTHELRELFTPAQLGALLKEPSAVVWLSGNITQDRAPELRRYLMRELGVAEFSPDALIPRVNRSFLEAQPDEWIRRLYEFLNGQPALLGRLEETPLVRLEDGRHVPPRANSLPQAFLPGPVTTGFPTVRAAVCPTDSARQFLRSLGLTEPDPVDDVVRNLLPKYRAEEANIGDEEYEATVRRLLDAFATDSKAQREKLVDALRKTPFVRAVDAGNGRATVKPGEVYLATNRLKALFEGVPGVWLVDDGVSCLKGEAVRELLEACGATRYLQPVEVESTLTWDERRDIRRKAGLERHTWEDPITDVGLRGLDALLDLLSRLAPQERGQRATLLWEALHDLESRRGSTVFACEYRWGYSHETKTEPFDAAFVRTLNGTAWVPDAQGNLQRPEFVLFDELSWKPDPVLLSKIRFKPPMIDQLEKAAGFEPGMLDFLKKHGVTSVEALAQHGLQALSNGEDDDSGSKTVPEAINSLIGNSAQPTSPVSDHAAGEPPPSGRGGRTRGGGGGADQRGNGATGDGGGGARGASHGAVARTAGSHGGRPFISYLAVHPHDEEPYSDGLDHPARMALESTAIDFILSREPKWQRTPARNPGYDLYQTDDNEHPTLWCEVKAMTGTLIDRPVGLTCTQFEVARQRREAYWLYVVEQAGTDKARIVRIQDPAGKAQTFTFDHGWLSIAEVDQEEDGEG